MAFHDTINTGTTPNDGQGDGLRTNIRKLHDNTKDNKQRLDDLNGNTPGVISTGGITVLSPLDAFFSGNGYVDGAIKIKLPQTWTDTMMRHTIEFFEYQQGKSFTVYVSGQYHPAGNWIHTSAQIICSDLTVNYPIRFGHDGVNCLIYIGELNEQWLYPKIYVVKSLLSHFNNSSSQWLTGWNISLETSSFQNVTKTHTNNLPVAQ